MVYLLCDIMKNKKVRNCLIVLSLILFLLVFILYITNGIEYIDSLIYNLVIKYKSNTMTKFMKVITFFGSVELGLIIFFLLLLLSIFKGRIPIIINFLIIGESLLNVGIKNIVRRSRPNILQLVFEDSYSFPSGHTMFSVVLYGFLIYLVSQSKFNKKIKYLCCIFLGLIPILVMVSRIYLGVHYFSDVMGGMFLAIAYLVIVIVVLERKKLL